MSISAYSGLSSLISPHTKPGAEAAKAANGGETKPSSDAVYAQVMGKYDLHNITPAEIDQLADDLVKADYPVTKDLMMLQTRGAEFQAHLSETFGGDFNPHKPVDLIQSVQTSIDMSRRSGDPTETMEHLLDFLTRHDSAAGLSGSADGSSGAHESLYRQLVEASAA